MLGDSLADIYLVQPVLSRLTFNCNRASWPLLQAGENVNRISCHLHHQLRILEQRLQRRIALFVVFSVPSPLPSLEFSRRPVRAWVSRAEKTWGYCLIRPDYGRPDRDIKGLPLMWVIAAAA